MYGLTIPCELFALGQIANQDTNKPRTNAYQEDVVNKQQQPHQELQQREPGEPLYSNTLDDDGEYECVAETELQRAGRLPPTTNTRR